MSYSETDKLIMARTREVLQRSEIARMEAVSKFPLVVASLANDMRKLLDSASYGGPIGDAELAYLRDIEDRIRKEFRQYFGTEMGPEKTPERHTHLGPDRECGICDQDLAAAVHLRWHETP